MKDKGTANMIQQELAAQGFQIHQQPIPQQNISFQGNLKLCPSVKMTKNGIELKFVELELTPEDFKKAVNTILNTLKRFKKDEAQLCINGKPQPLSSNMTFEKQENTINPAYQRYIEMRNRHNK